MQKKCKHLERRMCKGKSKTKIEIFHSFIERRQTMDAINRKSPLSLPALSLSCLLSQSAIMGDLQAQASTQYCALLHTHTLTQMHTHTLLHKFCWAKINFKFATSHSLSLLRSFSLFALGRSPFSASCLDFGHCDLQEEPARTTRCDLCLTRWAMSPAGLPKNLQRIHSISELATKR